MNERWDCKQVDAQTIRFRVRVTPKAKQATVGGTHDGALKVAVTEAPENGKANQAVVKAIAKQLSISRSSVAIVSGQTSRVKSVEVHGVSADQATERLGV
ncbi:hypothetical protein Mal15_14770 [Stieleria maiorica]|uniref:UPF0235 protein Mal15_14770 n=1 Tax=Stieleria maiorica TaxID=2795974 RepID=A0A5B9MDV4_9BACT|nr:DUF167 domain-containing protein [Stieleria maiorica]QEF97437.1 hypothetical protein Mal15_14770 [Stieleria maiorica]